MRLEQQQPTAFMSQKTKYVPVFYIQHLSKWVCVFYNRYGQTEPLKRTKRT